jgi:hypothetical protein
MTSTVDRPRDAGKNYLPASSTCGCRVRDHPRDGSLDRQLPLPLVGFPYRQLNPVNLLITLPEVHLIDLPSERMSEFFTLSSSYARAQHSLNQLSLLNS